jgi:hypothetical protein
MEEISPIYENVDISIWAQEIRLTKIYELEELIEEHKRYVEQANDYFYPKPYIDIVMKEIEKLKEKINILKTK